MSFKQDTMKKTDSCCQPHVVGQRLDVVVVVVNKRDIMEMELSRLKEESQFVKQKFFSDCPQTISPSIENSRIAGLENTLAILASKLVVIESKLFEVVEHEQMFSDRDRWNHINSLPETKIMLNRLFDLTPLSSCQLRDKEVILKEKYLLIGGYEEYIFKLNNEVIQLEAQKTAQNEINIKILQKFNALNNEGESSGVVEADVDTSDSEDMLKKIMLKMKLYFLEKMIIFAASVQETQNAKQGYVNVELTENHALAIAVIVQSAHANREDSYQVR